MPTFLCGVEAEGLAGEGVERLGDLGDRLNAEPDLTAPTLSADAEGGKLLLLVTVDARDEATAARRAADALEIALVATRRAFSDVRPMTPPTTPSPPIRPNSA